uniref:Uncharacterized protein n=1 Tax=Arundo donax TaxID=35708 RepID=A0A0A8Y960_ARUDO
MQIALSATVNCALSDIIF